MTLPVRYQAQRRITVGFDIDWHCVMMSQETREDAQALCSAVERCYSTRGCADIIETRIVEVAS